MPNFKSIQTLLREALKELKIEVLSDTPEITDEELSQVLSIAKEKILTEMGVDVQEFFDYEQGLKEIGKAKSAKKKEELQNALQETENRITSKIPSLPETLSPEAIRALIKHSTDQLPKPTTTIVNKIVKETTVKQPITQVIEKTIERINPDALYDVKKDIQYLQESFQNFKLPELPDFVKLKTDLKTDLEKQSADHIQGLWGEMPNFRALAMGLRGDIDDLKKNGTGGGDTIWQDIATVISPLTAGDSLDMGSRVLRYTIFTYFV